MAECNRDCNNCSAECAERRSAGNEKIAANSKSNIKKVIGVVSGKGGVGKSLVSCLLASKCAAEGLNVGILDADVTGPSVPRSFGVNGRVLQQDGCLIPVTAENGVKVMSVNLMLEDEESPVIWRGPVISGAINQFWSDVNWGNLDYLFVDMPPGTGDVAITVFQSLPVDGIVIVTTPQDLVTMIVKKAFNMAKMMNVPVLGIIENMGYYTCPCCGERLQIFGKSNTVELAKELGTKLLASLPLDNEYNKFVDEGRVFDIECKDLDAFVSALKEAI